MKNKEILEKIKSGKLSIEDAFSILRNNDSENYKDVNSELIYYRTIWEESEINNIGLGNELWNVLTNDTLLIFINEDLEIKEIKEKVNNVIVVKKGLKFSSIEDGVYEVNPSSLEDYRLLIKELKVKGNIPNRIWHCWAKGTFEDTEKMIVEQLNIGAYSILYLLKTLIEEKITKKIYLSFVHESEEKFSQPIFESIGSLSRSVSMENPNFYIKTIGISNSVEGTNKIFQVLIRENEIIENNEVYYVGAKRLIKKLKQIDIVNEELKKMKLKEEGVYLITGGAGALGLIFANYLAKNYKAKLVLTGRSDLTSLKEEKIKELEALGAEVRYIKCDVNSYKDLQNMVKEIKKIYKEINGVLHTAGVIQDSFLLKKTIDEIETVLAPKVYGSVLIDKVTKNENLDFFIMFSSISSILGNVGQSDYSYANAFMDNYANVRNQLVKNNKRSGKTISINWPLWADGGMQIDESKIKATKEALGIVPLKTDKGIEAFEKILQLDYQNVIIFEGDKEKVKQVLLSEVKNNTNEEKAKVTVNDDERSKIQIKLEGFMKDILASETKIPVSQIQSKEAFEKYGIDSIMILNINTNLEKYFGELSKTLMFEYQNIKDLTNYFIENKLEKTLEIIGIDNKKSNIINSKDKDKDNIQPKIKPQRFFDKSNNERIIIDDIAIIGVSGRYPMANNLDKFWENFLEGKDCITEIPKDRWNYNDFYDPDKEKFGKSYSKWGGFIENIDKFDPLFFNISPMEAKFIAPQERIFLETVWHTLEDAGYTRSRMEKSKVGVFVGVMYGEYQLYGVEETLKGNPMSLNSSYSSIANRVSYFYNFRGPSMALDTMCSSALTAVHLACESIFRGESEMAIAGGVNANIHPNKYLTLCQGRFASSDGKCRSFGEGGDGYVPGEGVGAVLLKSLSKAEEDGDRIYAVIKGTSVNHGGKTNGYSVPNPISQAEVISETIEKSNIDPRTISYIEGQGTGTTLGDPIEISSLNKAFSKYTKDKQYCPIGSAKSNIGHLESAGGIAAITKVLLQMKYKKLVPSLHSEILNPNINFNESPFYVQQEVSEWKQPTINGQIYPRRAGINAFGAGGSNAHMIVEEYENTGLNYNIDIENNNLIVLSARNKDRLKVYAQNLYEYIEKNKEDLQLNDIAYTLQIGREAMDERLALIVTSVKELIENLKEFCNNNISNIFLGNCRDNKLDLGFFINGKEGDSYINTIIEERKLEKLARLWINGVDIDFTELHVKGKIVSLPGYPFLTERYWVPKFNEENTADKNNSIIISDEDNNVLSKKVTENITYWVAEILGMNKKDLDINTELFQYGINSISMMQLANRIRDEYNNFSSYALILQQKTIKGIVAHICSDIVSNKVSEDGIKKPFERKKVEYELPVEKVDGSKLKTDIILLNGVTGVLGGRLVLEYLRNSDSTIYCLVRAKDKEQAKDRIKKMVSVHKPNKNLIEKFEEKVIPILGDVTNPMLGLEEEEYNKLANIIDMVVHVVAITSLHGLYKEVKDVNVNGTKNMIDFAMKTKQKYMIHTSTIGIMGELVYSNNPPLTEKDYDIGQKFESLGYERSKFEAEHLVRSASKDGLNWIIVRPGYIMGDSRKGYYPFGITSVPGIFYDNIKTAIEMKVFYDFPFYYDVTPVDYVSSAMVYLSTEVKDIYQTYHLNNPTPTTSNDIIKYVNEYGYDVNIISFIDFVEILKSKENTYHSMTTELLLLNLKDELEIYEYSYIDATYTKEVLQKGGIICPPVDKKLIKTYLDYCIEIEYIKPPRF